MNNPRNRMITLSVFDERRHEIKDMPPEKRRRYCAYLSRKLSKDCENSTGKFFNMLAGAKGVKEPDYKDLGRKIMNEHNSYYKYLPKESNQKTERRNK